MSGSIDFNGTTSKAQNTTADVFNSLKTYTVLAWVFTRSAGETGGRFLAMDEGEANTSITFGRSSTTAHTLFVNKNPGAAGTGGVYRFTAQDLQWNAVAVAGDFSTDVPPSYARVNFANAPFEEASAPSGQNDQPATGYCVGNNSGQTRSFDGKIAHVQVFNRIITQDEADRALRKPGSITADLRLYLRLANATDLANLAPTGSGFDATGTDLTTGADGPPLIPSLSAASLRVFPSLSNLYH